MHKVTNILTKTKITADIENLTFDVDSYDNLHSLATQYVLEKDYESCLDVLVKIEELHGPSSQLNLQKGICLYRLGYIKNAIDELEQSLVLDEANQDANLLLPRLKQKLENLSKYCMVSFYG